jgi:hypothetical protein
MERPLWNRSEEQLSRYELGLASLSLSSDVSLAEVSTSIHHNNNNNNNNNSIQFNSIYLCAKLNKLQS